MTSVYFLGATLCGAGAMAHFGRRYGGGEEAASNAQAAILLGLFWPVVALGLVILAAVCAYDWLTTG